MRFVMIWGLLAFIGCTRPSADSAATNVATQVAIDVRSQQVYLVAATAQLPMENPQDSKSQLQPALYCSECEKWYPTPPLEELNRNPGATICPKHRTPLIVDGPTPADSIDLTGKERA